MEIKTCGPGCAKCNEMERVVNEVLSETGKEATVIKVSDFKAIAGLGVFSTPAVVIGGQVECVDRVPPRKDVLARIG